LVLSAKALPKLAASRPAVFKFSFVASLTSFSASVGGGLGLCCFGEQLALLALFDEFFGCHDSSQALEKI
jgi:hypothetical protein